MEINRNNYESFFLLYLDRELNASDQLTVENFLSENADLQKEFRLLQKTVLWPAEIIFEQKESLFRREEKRRFLPVYWTSIAAAFTLILAASWFVMTILKNHPNDHSAREQKKLTLETKKNPETKANLNPIIQQAARKNESSQDLTERGNPGNGIFPVKVQTQRGTADQVQTVNEQKNKNQETRNGKIHHEGNEQIYSATSEDLMAVRKLNVELELQAGGNQYVLINPGPIQAPIVAQTPALLLEAASQNPNPVNESNREPDIQTENAISVIALNDRNKAIAGFFKKLTKRAPAEETAGNNKKLRVSVFQFSY